MPTRKSRKSKVVKHKLCPECNAIKRYTICLKCGFMSDEDKEKDKKFWEEYSSERK